ncbi:GUN4 domain-containing protein [Gloeocapsopsis dulcis]|uniref:GUN4 domain-containing protein n=1 Tax=Gloeocapsopsis dulcis TaxID=2859516 RepID=UPI000CF6C70A|nr:GUN4 domain-containing protein [Gloeocapsopsis dulcis]WNN89765.1 GUN4 domain-containing protein [Gloeocapsopsis dulcis]
MPRAVILTALPVEYLAVRTHLTDLQEEMHPQGTIYERGKFVANGQVWEVGIAEVGAGNAGADVEAERASAYFKPDILFFVGIAGGIKDVAIGDVVAATKVYGYESGKVGDQFFTRPALGQSAYTLVQRARSEARKAEWLQRLSTSSVLQPRVFVAPIAAGEKVVASRQSDVFNLIRASYNDAIAVEMEGFGFLSAVFAYPNIKAIVIRGISDLIESKNDDSPESGQEPEQIRQEKASHHASAFAFEILARFCLDQSSLITPKNIHKQDIDISKPKSDKKNSINEYRQRFEEYTSDGVISPIESVILQDLQTKLELTESEVCVVQDEVLAPHKRYQENLDQYEKHIIKLVTEQGYPLKIETLVELKKLKDYLQLKSNDVISLQETVRLKSLRRGGIDYTKLHELLVKEEWEEADRETWNILCQVAGKQKEGLLDRKDIEKISCEELQVIDRLWLRLSEGRLGFTVQKKIYQELNEIETELERIKEFGRRVNWLKRRSFTWFNNLKKLTSSNGNYREINVSSDDLPIGFLPICIWWNLGTKDFEEWREKVAVECETNTEMYRKRILDARDWLRREEPRIKQKEREGERVWEGVTLFERLENCEI